MILLVSIVDTATVHSLIRLVTWGTVEDDREADIPEVLVDSSDQAEQSDIHVELVVVYKRHRPMAEPLYILLLNKLFKYIIFCTFHN